MNSITIEDVKHEIPEEVAEFIHLLARDKTRLENLLKRTTDPVATLRHERVVSCLGCLKADTLLKLALTAARGRLLNIDNAEHDKTFNKIAEYLDEKYPNKGGCPSLD